MAKDKENTGSVVATDEAEAVVEEAPQLSPEEEKAQLVAELEAAIASKDYAKIAAVSRKVDQFERKNEKLRTEEKLARLKVLADGIGEDVMEVLSPRIEAGELDEADGIWINIDFGDVKDGQQVVVVRLTKAAAKAKSGGTGGGGGGAGKKFDVGTEDLLSKYGNEEMKDGKTYQQVWDESADKNNRYAVRKALLKRDGLV